MKSKCSFKINGRMNKEDSVGIQEAYRGIFLKKAEEDYVAFRVLITMNLIAPAYFHLHQCIEKYLKAFVLDRKISHPSLKNKNGHKLEYWANLCSQEDDFFKDEELIKGLSELSHLVELARYPQDTIQSYVSTPTNLVEFLDEFVFEMRTRIKHIQYEDVIQKFLDGYISCHPKLTHELNKSITSEQIRQFITHKNKYFK